MPKETTYGLQHPSGNTGADSGATITLEGFAQDKPIVPIVDVMWNRETGFVQVVTKATDANGGRWIGDSPETHFTDGMHVDLDRAAINRLIRNLRRARDNAFGRDE